MHTIFILMIVVFTAGQAFAAPMWLERRAVPQLELIDPVFEKHSEEATLTPDYSLWGEFLEKYVALDEVGIARVAYAAVSVEDRAALSGFLTAQQATDVTALARNQQLAFWINLYNAATVNLILAHYPVQSIRNIEIDGDGPWDTNIATVNGVPLTLNGLEHGIVRPVFGDARIHYAVNCASVGCPNLAAEPYTAQHLGVMLDAAARAYVNHPRGVSVNRNRASVSKIYGWYREDFGGDDAVVLNHIRRYAGPELAAALKGVDTIRSYNYDWSLNDRRPAN